MSRVLGMEGGHNHDSRAQILKYPRSLQGWGGKVIIHPAGWINSRHMLGK